MSQWNSASEILDFAIANEEEAAAFYRELGAKSNSPSMGKVFEGYAKEEDQHKAKLLRVKQAGNLKTAEKKVVDLQIGDYLVDTEPNAEMDYQQLLIVAMKREKAAFKLYTDMAAATDDADLSALLSGLAQEEAKHKLRFEIEYDEHILTEN